jgi:hypothetical protein
MTSIVVAVPKAEVDHFWEPIPEGNIAWWTLSRKPKRLRVGDYIYFAISNELVAKAVVRELREDRRVCEATGRTWEGVHVVWNAGDLQKLKDKSAWKISRGFHYFQIRA